MAQTHVAGTGATDGAPLDLTDKRLWALALGAVGVVYGDIGTSPLYAFREAILAGRHEGISSREAVLGVLSLIVWSLTLIVTFKYVMILLRADNKGEGGVFALMALSHSVAKRSTTLIFVLGIAGASFFYGDAVITPAISVLSAVEGLKLVSPAFEKAVVPLALVILVALVSMQSHGTEKVARFFGPITLAWFLAMAAGGLMHVLDDPTVLGALNPLHGIVFVASHGLIGLSVMGLVFLAVTGAEALYADLGHFGRRPIQAAWLTVVMPSLLLNYFGQGALVLASPEAMENPFYRLYPDWALMPMVLLATLATVIASQAVITGAMSLTRQAIQLGLLPRMHIQHMSESVVGQIYMPRVNWGLLAAVVLVVLLFRDSGSLAAAYGVAVTATMVLTTLLTIFVVWRLWGWPLWKALLLLVPLLLIEQSFLIANALKVLDGGWMPLLLAAIVGITIWTWVVGSRLLAKATRRSEADFDWLARKLVAKPPHLASGTALFLTADIDTAPRALLHNLKHNRVLHERNILLSIKTEETPRWPRHERVEIDRFSDRFVRVTARYGFMETPSVPKILDHCRRRGLNIDAAATSFFLSRRSLRVTRNSEMPIWQERLFITLARSAEDATTYFQIPTDRVVEIGTQVAV